MEVTHLHLGHIGIRRGVAAVQVGQTGLGLAQVLAGGVEGRFGHFEDRCKSVALSGDAERW